MDIFKEMEQRGHEQVIFNFDKASGLKAIIAIHNTTLGPAIGGCRMMPYGTEDAALDDVLRLSEAMTAKAAIAGLDFGGGKVVVIGNPVTDKNEGLFRALGRYVHTLDGRILIGEDIGTTPHDLTYAQKETPYIVGLPAGYGGSGDTGEFAAMGVIHAIRAALTVKFGTDSLRGRRVVVQGLGKTGYRVAEHAINEGAVVIAADNNPHNVGKAAAQLGIEPMDPWAVIETACDVLSPCALGNVVNRDTIGKLQCSIIAGAANNQLENPAMGQKLMERGILYAPDFIANSGGLIQVANEIESYNAERVQHQIDGIYELLLSIFESSQEQNLPTNIVAMQLVDQRLALLNAIHRIYNP